MKTVIILAAVALALAAAKPQGQDPSLVKFDLLPDGSYTYSFQTDDQITKQENGKLVNAGAETEHIAVDGSYTYTGTDGKQVSVTYVADDTGFHPKFVIGSG